MISVDNFQLQAREWLAANKSTAPRDYGAYYTRAGLRRLSLLTKEFACHAAPK